MNFYKRYYLGEPTLPKLFCKVIVFLSAYRGVLSQSDEYLLYRCYSDKKEMTIAQLYVNKE